MPPCAKSQVHSVVIKNEYGQTTNNIGLDGDQLERLRTACGRLGRQIDADLGGQPKKTVTEISPDLYGDVSCDTLKLAVSILKDREFQWPHEDEPRCETVLRLCHAFWEFECIPDETISGYFEGLRSNCSNNTSIQSNSSIRSYSWWDERVLENPDYWVAIALTLGWDIDTLKSICRVAIFESSQAASMANPFQNMLNLQEARKNASDKTINCIKMVFLTQLVDEKDDVKETIIEIMKSIGIKFREPAGEETEAQVADCPVTILQTIHCAFGGYSGAKKASKNGYRTGGARRAPLTDLVIEGFSAVKSMSKASKLREKVREKEPVYMRSLEEDWSKVVVKVCDAFCNDLLNKRDQIRCSWPRPNTPSSGGVNSILPSPPRSSYASSSRPTSGSIW